MSTIAYMLLFYGPRLPPIDRRKMNRAFKAEKGQIQFGSRYRSDKQNLGREITLILIVSSVTELTINMYSTTHFHNIKFFILVSFPIKKPINKTTYLSIQIGVNKMKICFANLGIQ